MRRLNISLLGSFQVSLDNEPVTMFESDKVRALLSYLVVESDRPHRREALAGLLWPDWPDRKALSNLRYVLSNLRKAIGDHQAKPALLRITRTDIQFNQESDYWLDTAEFIDGVKQKPIDNQGLVQLESVVSWYRGDFLKSFSLADSNLFEEWCTIKREQYSRFVLEALHWLATAYAIRGDNERALVYARQQVDLAPWDEGAQRQLMRLLVFDGRRSEALVQYKACQDALNAELGVEPAAETVHLYNQIRDNQLISSSKPPAFLLHDQIEFRKRPAFVARKSELSQLDSFLHRSIAGSGRLLFVKGEAGQGKTALIEELIRRSEQRYEDIIAVQGSARAFAGVGDPYLPFRKIISMLTGDVEDLWLAGAVSQAHAQRIWHRIPSTVKSLIHKGPALIDTFLKGTALLNRTEQATLGEPAWLEKLRVIIDRNQSGSVGPPLQQTDLFDQYSNFLGELSKQYPIIIFIDDLHWADLGSISLLFHLSRNLSDQRILLIGAFRPAELVMEQTGERHPLDKLINESMRQFGDVFIDLDDLEERELVESYLDIHPNCLDLKFRDMLFTQTRGHPLFTVELIRSLQESQGLVKDQNDAWIEGPDLDWETLPPRVEGVIAERIRRLSQRLQNSLQIASVEGIQFTAEVIAGLQNQNDLEITSQLSGELETNHQLVSAVGFLQVEKRRLARYRFRHTLFQKYMYQSLDPVERSRLHKAVGTELEMLAGSSAVELAPQLAKHFEEAGIMDKAIHYLMEAGNRAVRLSANDEAITHFRRGLGLLGTLPENPENIQRELNLQINLTAPLMASKGYGAPELGVACERARVLSTQVEETLQLYPVLWHLGSFYSIRAELQTAYTLLDRTLNLAEQAGDPELIAMTKWGKGFGLLRSGQFEQSYDNLRQTIAFYDPKLHQHLAFTYGTDPGVACLSWAAWDLWFLGRPDQSSAKSREAIALSRELAHPFSSVFALGVSALLHLIMRDTKTAGALVEETTEIATEHNFPFWLVQITFMRGWLSVLDGRIIEGIDMMREGMSTYQIIGCEDTRSMLLTIYADALNLANRPNDCQKVLDEAVEFVENTGERFYEAELYRVRGELLLRQNEFDAAEVGFRKAIQIARQQGALSWELRASSSLCKLLIGLECQEEAHLILSAIISQFDPSLDTPDLAEARALLR